VLNIVAFKLFIDHAITIEEKGPSLIDLTQPWVATQNKRSSSDSHKL
jgi:hypothetical protein